MLDVRPAEEYLTTHLPFARSIPMDELRQRLADLPKDRPVVAYCRGPFCLMAKDAVDLLRKEGFRPPTCATAWRNGGWFPAETPRRLRRATPSKRGTRRSRNLLC
ncbi:MAG: rhodanese-like domain-containing protein [Sulfurisoma sp.]|nr:rhodanese-like domain-containing protein [Sulfurisoma sp.]